MDTGSNRAPRTPPNRMKVPTSANASRVNKTHKGTPPRTPDPITASNPPSHHRRRYEVFHSFAKT